MTPDQIAWQTQSVLLGYPDTWPSDRALLRRAASTLDTAVGRPLLGFLDHASRVGAPELAADYVATFDQRKKCCLYLTYYAHGDTRKRGMALLALKQRYAAAGLALRDDELPDHLAVALEYAASVDPSDGRELLVAHRAGLELLRLALLEAKSPWAGVLTSVCATLPPLRGDESTAVARLAAQGPPEEQVGVYR
jgi:nitrate reductase delta subunit